MDRLTDKRMRPNLYYLPATQSVTTDRTYMSFLRQVNRGLRDRIIAAFHARPNLLVYCRCSQEHRALEHDSDLSLVNSNGTLWPSSNIHRECSLGSTSCGRKRVNWEMCQAVLSNCNLGIKEGNLGGLPS